MPTPMPVTGGYQQAQPSGWSRATIEGIAERFAKQVGYSPSMSLEDLVSAFGGRLRSRDFLVERSGRDDRGSVEIDGVRDFSIFLPTHTSGAENRFTVAHELGHYVLHFLLLGGVQPVMAARYGGGELVEDEANWFASSFLIGRDELRRMAERGASESELESTFRVPPYAVRGRKATLESPPAIAE